MARMTRRHLLPTTLALVAGSFDLPRAAPAAPIRDDLAPGDSMALGETSFTQDPSYGDRGSVGLYADSPASHDGGVRPHVIDLGGSCGGSAQTGWRGSTSRCRRVACVGFVTA